MFYFLGCVLKIRMFTVLFFMLLLPNYIKNIKEYILEYDTVFIYFQEVKYQFLCKKESRFFFAS